MKAYSLDLRERVVAAYQNGFESIREVSEQFQVGTSFLKKMLAKHRTSGDLARSQRRQTENAFTSAPKMAFTRGT